MNLSTGEVVVLQALLKGKLSQEQQNMEDILTSNVFGILKYFPPEDGLAPFLRKAEDQNGAGLGLRQCIGADYEFWPRMAELGCERAEPDVVITLTHPDSTRTVILVEAKYRSGKSSEGDDGDNDDDQLAREYKPYDQLAREYDNLVKRCERKGIAQGFLVYCTADFRFPKTDVKASIKDYKKSKSGRAEGFGIFWLSWRCLPKLLENKKPSILLDLALVLRKLRLHSYEGIPEPGADVLSIFGGPSWEYHHTTRNYLWPADLPSLPEAYTYRGKVAGYEGIPEPGADVLSIVRGPNWEYHHTTSNYLWPADLPSLPPAYIYGENAAGYDWPDPSTILEGVKPWRWKVAKAFSR